MMKTGSRFAHILEKKFGKIYLVCLSWKYMKTGHVLDKFSQCQCQKQIFIAHSRSKSLMH